MNIVAFFRSQKMPLEPSTKREYQTTLWLERLCLSNIKKYTYPKVYLTYYTTIMLCMLQMICSYVDILQVH